MRGPSLGFYTARYQSVGPSRTFIWQAPAWSSAVRPQLSFHSVGPEITFVPRAAAEHCQYLRPYRAFVWLAQNGISYGGHTLGFHTTTQAGFSYGGPKLGLHAADTIRTNQDRQLFYHAFSTRRAAARPTLLMCDVTAGADQQMAALCVAPFYSFLHCFLTSNQETNITNGCFMKN